MYGEAGRRGRIESIEIRGHEQTAEWYIRSQITIEPGSWYDGTTIDTSRREVYLTGLFRSVDIDHEWISEDTMRIVVTVAEEDSRSVDLLGGYGSYERMRGLVRFEDRNVFGTGRRFSVEGRASTRGARGAATLTDPRFFNTRTRFTLSADIFERQEPSFTDRAQGLTAAFSRDLGGGLKARIGYAFRDRSGSTTDSVTNLEDFTQGNVFTELKLDRRDSILYPRSGFLCELQLDTDDPAFGSDVSFRRARFTASGYVPIYRDFHLALGAATGRSTARRRAWPTGWLGTRTARLSSPALHKRAIRLSGRRGRTRVRGPGQKRAATASARSDQTTSARTPSASAKWEISGLNFGRPLASKMRATACSSVASAPSP